MGESEAGRGAGNQDRPRPSWQREVCPTWCARVHEEGDHPDDRVHQSEADVIGVLLGAPFVTEQPPAWLPAELVIRLSRRVGEAMTWVTIEDAEDDATQIVLPFDSARLLEVHLSEQLRLHDLG